MDNSTVATSRCEAIRETIELLEDYLPIPLRFGDFEELQAKIVLLCEKKQNADKVLLETRVQYPASNDVLLPDKKPLIWNNLNTFARQAFCDAKRLIHEDRCSTFDKPQYIYYKTAKRGWQHAHELLSPEIRKGASSLKEYLLQKHGQDWCDYLPAKPDEELPLCTEVTCTKVLGDVKHLLAALPERAEELLAVADSTPYDKFCRLFLPSTRRN